MAIKPSFTAYAQNFINNVNPQNQSKSNLAILNNNSEITSHNDYTNNNFILLKSKANLVEDAKNCEEEIKENNLSMDVKENKSRIRKDRNGVVIKKGSKKHKITFVDKIKGRGNYLVERVDIPSYKEMNITDTNYDNQHKKTVVGNCCLLY